MSADTIPFRRGPASRRLLTKAGPIAYWVPDSDPVGPTVLLLHGAACGAWVWAEGFAAALAEAGCRVAAPDLPNGPGATLADRLAVVRATMAVVGGPVVLVGHSLGALLAQRLAGESSAVAQVLLAPVPPEGLWASNLALLWGDPALWREVARLEEGPGNAEPGLATRLFGPRMADAAARRVLARLGGESRAAILEAQTPQPVPPGWAAACPATVIAGEADRLIPTDAAWRCALWHGTVPDILPAAGHLLMLEPGWETVVARILQVVGRIAHAAAGPPLDRAWRGEGKAWTSTSRR
jgi:pimeloyl-ACP methyl ester carboxylesterase